MHVLKVHNAVTGHHYELTLEQQGNTWHARWLTRDGNNTIVPNGLQGSLTRDDSEAAFRAAKRIIGDADLAVIDNDWDFLEPLPPWLAE